MVSVSEIDGSEACGMSEQIRPESVRFARGLFIAIAFSMVAVGLLVAAFTFTVDGWMVLAGVGVGILWLCRDKEPQP